MVIGEVVIDEELEALSHLHPAARRLARRSDAERLGYVRADRWIGYTRANEAMAQLETLFTWPVKQRMPNLLLIGPTNNGKSMIVEKFRRSHPPVSHADREEIPVLAVQMPSEPSVTRFYTALLAALGTPLRPRQRLAELEVVGTVLPSPFEVLDGITTRRRLRPDQQARFTPIPTAPRAEPLNFVTVGATEG